MDSHFRNYLTTIAETSISPQTKENGFYKIKLSPRESPIKLTFGNYVYDLTYYVGHSDGGNQPIKAKSSENYLLSRKSVSEFPNLYFTRDFKDLKKMSELKPESKYKWYSSELHSYSQPDGKVLQGILYKPDDFDSTKKYPIIFNIYEQLSDGLNEYLVPGPLCVGCQINIPLMVSRGYLVFSLDVGSYKANKTGETALHSVLAAAEHVKQFQFIDTNNMGIQGCSFGGFEINYIVSHTNRFKAVCSAGSVSDIMGFGHLAFREVYSHFTYGQLGIWKKPWEDPQVFIDNSPIFSVDKVNTPMLLFHTTIDSASPFNQGVQFFLSLRRLGKPSWLLEYGGNANHGVFDDKQQRDFSERMLQFFDHYLKDKPAPKWMTEGIPARDAATKTGLELESK